MKDDGIISSNRWRRHLVGIGITILCLFVIVRQVDLAELIKVMSQFRLPWLFLGIFSLGVGYIFRIKRWQIMLQNTGVPATFNNCVAPFLGSIALNNILPLRIGDIVRALIFPKAMGISRTTSTSTLLMERLFDLLTLLACLGIGLLAVQKVEISYVFLNSALLLSFLGVTALAVLIIFSGNLGRLFGAMASSGKPGKFSDRLKKFYSILHGLLVSFETMSQPRALLMTLLLSMFVWIGESGLFYFVMLGFGLDANPLMALIVMSIATLATLVPSSPGYVGPFHLAAFTVVSLAGGTASQAGAFAVLVHLALWASTTAAGALAIWFRPELFRYVRKAAV